MSWWKVGVALGISMLVGGCYRESDDFNAKAADYVCEYNEDDPEQPFLDRSPPVSDTDATQNPPYGGPFCEDAVQANLESCSAECEYTPRKARRCLRQLRRAVRRGSYNESVLKVCDEVYECSTDVPQGVASTCRITTHQCAVGDQDPPAALFALGLLGLWVRRRHT